MQQVLSERPSNEPCVLFGLAKLPGCVGQMVRQDRARFVRLQEQGLDPNKTTVLAPCEPLRPNSTKIDWQLHNRQWVNAARTAYAVNSLEGHVIAGCARSLSIPTRLSVAIQTRNN